MQANSPVESILSAKVQVVRRGKKEWVSWLYLHSNIPH